MLSRRPRQTLPPTLRLLVAGGRQWARDAGQLAIFRILGGLFLALVLLSRAVMLPQVVHPRRPFQIDDNPGPLKLLIISLEFRKCMFSGNGVYAQSIARSLAQKGLKVLVLSGKPVKNMSAFNITIGKKQESSKDTNMQKHRTNFSNNSAAHSVEEVTNKKLIKPDSPLGVIELEVDVEEDGWGRLDWKCPWKSFAQGISVHKEYVLQFNPSWALIVDWSAVPAFETLSTAVGIHYPMAFLNFRVYTVSEYQGQNGQAEKQFYKEMESKAVAMASAISALSSRDAHILATELGGGLREGVVPKPHFPPLREDLQAIALASKADSAGFQSTDKWLNNRAFFTCCVRLSPEKNAELFASVVEMVAGFLRQEQIVPFLCGGAKGGSHYAERVKSRLRTAMHEAIIYDGFMDAPKLAELYSRTLLNVHPCIYDAYGMTIVEAAAFASPSVVHVGPGGAVGAAEFLNPREGQVLALDLTAPPSILAISIKEMLLNRTHLAEVGQAASIRSLSWNEDANADQLIGILQSAPTATSKSEQKVL